MIGHVTVVGSGPTGLLLAAALSQRGVGVTIVDPRPTAPWTAQYSCWAREAAGAGEGSRDVIDRATAARFESVSVMFGAETCTASPSDGGQRLDEPYLALDGERLRTGLWKVIAGDVVTAAVTRVEHTSGRSTVHHDAGQFTSDLVVDCTGSGALMPRQSPAVFQTAYGLHVRLAAPWRHGAILMDYRPPAKGLAGGTFLYALPFPDGTILLEETSLAARPAMPLEVLQHRLEARLASYGAEVVEVLRVERCTIAMDRWLPEPGRTVAFGAAAGYVHPATGYQVGFSMRMAPQVAGAVARALAAGVRGEALSLVAWDAVWTPDARAAHTLHRFGAEALLRLDDQLTRRFFDAFFSMPERLWSGYLQRTLVRSDLLAAMWQLFRRAPWAVRLRLQAAALRDPSELIAGVFGRRGGAAPVDGPLARGAA